MNPYDAYLLFLEEVREKACSPTCILMMLGHTSCKCGSFECGQMYRHLPLDTVLSLLALIDLLQDALICSHGVLSKKTEEK